MKSFVIIFIVCIITALRSHSQSAKVIKIAELQEMFVPLSDTTYIINFMATWCKPCMEELPYFEKISTDFKSSKLKVIYISLDAVSDISTKLNPMLTRRKITNATYLLDETNYNAWIDKIETTWDGAIPVTFIINNDKKFKKFISTATTYDSLKTIVQQLN